MNKPAPITIAIITKCRPKNLNVCLLNLLKQTLPFVSVIVIDNDDKKSAKKIIKKTIFKRLNIVYYHYPKKTVPACRNQALLLNKSNYLAFIDDDCIANHNWLKTAYQQLKQDKADYVLGKTKLINNNNLFALAQHARDNFWKIHHKQLFDTKNVLLNSSIIKKHQLFFDELCQSNFYDSADYDFDFQLKNKNLKKTYSPKMLVFHKEVSNFKNFKKRAFHRGKLGKYLNNKWKLNNNLIDFKDAYTIFFLARSLKNYFNYFKKYRNYLETKSFSKKIIAISLIRVFERYYTVGYVKNQ